MKKKKWYQNQKELIKKNIQKKKKKKKNNSENEIEIRRRNEWLHIGWQPNNILEKKITCFSAIPLQKYITWQILTQNINPTKENLGNPP